MYAPPPFKASVDLLEMSHTAAVRSLSYVSGLSDAVVTCSADGSVRLWMLDTYEQSWVFKSPDGRLPTCVWADRAQGGAGAAAVPGGAPLSPAFPSQIYAGFNDGSLGAFDVSGPSHFDGRGVSESWKALAHKGGVTSISGNKALVVTGGNDGCVCVWSRKGKDLLLQFKDHSKPVLSVAVDAHSLEKVFSLGADRVLNTYSLRLEKRIRMHTLGGAAGTIGGGAGMLGGSAGASAGLLAAGLGMGVPGGGAAAAGAGGTGAGGSGGPGSRDVSSVSLTCLVQNWHPKSEGELFSGSSDGRIFIWDSDIPDRYIGCVSLSELHQKWRGTGSRGGAEAGASAMTAYAGGRGGAAAAGGGVGFASARSHPTAGMAGGGMSAAAAAIAASSTAGPSDSFRITALAASPSGRFLAAATADGRLFLLRIGEPKSAAAIPLPAGYGAGTVVMAGGRAPSMMRGQPSLGLQVGGQEAPGSGVGGGSGGAGGGGVCDLQLLDVFCYGNTIVAVQWAWDEKQLVCCSSDACVAVLNWYGA